MTRIRQQNDCALPLSLTKMGDMARAQNPKVPLTFRVSPEAAIKIRAFLADHCGKPLYIKPGSFVEAALLREMERIELILAGALPANGGDALRNRKTAIAKTRKNSASAIPATVCGIHDR